MQSTRILLLDDHELFRECLAARLDTEPGFRIVACCGSVEEALSVLAREPVDIVLLDLDLGAERGAIVYMTSGQIDWIDSWSISAQPTSSSCGLPQRSERTNNEQ